MNEPTVPNRCERCNAHLTFRPAAEQSALCWSCALKVIAAWRPVVIAVKAEWLVVQHLMDAQLAYEKIAPRVPDRYLRSDDFSSEAAAMYSTVVDLYDQVEKAEAVRKSAISALLAAETGEVK